MRSVGHTPDRVDAHRSVCYPKPMKLINALLFVCVCLTSCVTKPKTEQQSGMPRIHNLAPDFIEYWNQVKEKPLPKQIQKLKSDFLVKFPQFYNYKIGKWERSGQKADEEFGKIIKEYPQLEANFIKKTDQVTETLNITLASFLKSFPEMNQDFDVYLTHSFGEMDGGTRNIGGKIYLIFGIDGMVNYHKGFTSEIPFFHHELFHIYHGQYFPEEQVIWIALWTEGLASYASQKLNPEASMKDLILDLPEGMVRKIDKSLDEHWADLTKKLNSKSDIDYETYFLMSSKDKKIVPRAGYYLGYLLAKEVGKTKSVNEMAQMKPNEVLPLLKLALKTVRKEKTNEKPNKSRTKIRS